MPIDQTVQISVLGEDDIPAFIACVRRCYGDSYTEPEFYDPDHLRAELTAHRLLSVGARVGRRVVGHIGTRVPTMGDAVAETIGGFVEPDYRGLGLVRRMGAEMVANYQRLGIRGIRHLATGAHDRTQRLLVSSGAVATGVLLGHIAAGTDYRGIEHGFGQARIGAVVYFQSFGPLDALDVFVPERFAARVRAMYREVELTRRIATTDPTRVGAKPGTVRTGTVSVRHDERQGISWMHLGPSSGSTEPATAEAVQRALHTCQSVVYADVPIADPHNLAMLELLDAHRFCFGALLPGNSDTEAIRMQRLSGARIAPHEIVTASPGGRSLLEWITSDHERANASPSSPASTRPSRGV